MTVTQRKYLLFAAIFVAVLTADQVTKYQAVARLTTAFAHGDARTFADRVRIYFAARNLGGEPPEKNHPDMRLPPYDVGPDAIKQIWSMKYVENPGAAWGMFARMPPWFRVPFFHIVSIIAIGFLLMYMRKAHPDQKLLLVALSLVLGGAVGNYTDRLMRSYVIDFVDWHWRTLHWPTFNVADAAICIGVALMVGETLFTNKHKVAVHPPPEMDPDPAGAGASSSQPGQPFNTPSV